MRTDPHHHRGLRRTDHCPALAAAQTAPAIPPSITTPDKVETSIGTLEYKDGAPSKETVAKVYDYLDLMHGVEAFVNAYQGASVAAIFKGMEDAGVPNNTALIFSELMDAKSLFLTANADTVYFWVNLDVTKGPIVVETPPLSLGVIDDMWFQWVTDFGLPGPDRGEGGKYLFVPPDYKGELPDSGYFVQKMRTTRATMLGRSFLENNDPKPVVALIKKTLKVYPYLPGGYGTSIGSALAGQGDAWRARRTTNWTGPSCGPQEPVKFTEGTGKVMNTIPPNDFSYFEMINDLVQKEPVGRARPGDHGVAGRHRHREGQALQSRRADEEDPDRRGGHRNGRGPNLELAVRARPRGGYYYPNSAWIEPALRRRLQLRNAAARGQRGRHHHPQPAHRRPHAQRRARRCSSTPPFITPAMIMRLTGIGSQYLGAFVDSKGEYFDGGKTYKVTLPPNIPAEKFWSFTVYDNQTRSMLDTPQRYPRAGSQSYPTPAAEANADGSTTVYFGPSKPAGVSDGNWIQTDPGKGWNTILRLYSPLEPFFTKEWRPSEIELVAG